MKYLTFLVVAVICAGSAAVSAGYVPQAYSPFPSTNTTVNPAPRKVVHHHAKAVRRHAAVRRSAAPRQRLVVMKMVAPIGVYARSASELTSGVVTGRNMVPAELPYGYVVVEEYPNMYVERGFEPIYSYMSVQDPRYNPALRDAGGGGG